MSLNVAIQEVNESKFGKAVIDECYVAVVQNLFYRWRYYIIFHMIPHDYIYLTTDGIKVSGGYIYISEANLQPFSWLYLFVIYVF